MPRVRHNAQNQNQPPKENPLHVLFREQYGVEYDPSNIVVMTFYINFIVRCMTNSIDLWITSSSLALKKHGPEMYPEIKANLKNMLIARTVITTLKNSDNIDNITYNPNDQDDMNRAVDEVVPKVIDRVEAARSLFELMVPIIKKHSENKKIPVSETNGTLFVCWQAQVEINNFMKKIQAMLNEEDVEQNGAG